MPRPNPYRQQTKDMYWFAHGGIEPPANQCQQNRSGTPGPGDTEDESSESSSLTWKSNQDRRANSEEPVSFVKPKTTDQLDGSQPAGLPRLNSTEKRLAAEERRRQLQEAEQEKNEAILKKHAEREAALEARRNAQRSNISFAFGSAVPPNGEIDIMPVQVSSSHSIQPRTEKIVEKDGSVDGCQPPNAFSRQTIFPTSWLVGSGALVATNGLMTQSMMASVSTARGRRKNDLTPAVPYDRVGPQRPTAPVRKRSVSMSRLDVLAQPRRPYVEAQKANSTMSSSSSNKDVRQSPNRPLSAASEKSSGAKNQSTSITRRPQTAARKSRPISIAGSIPDSKKPVRTSTPMRTFTTNKQHDAPNISAIVSSTTRAPRAKSVSSTDRSHKFADKQKSPMKSPSPAKPLKSSTPTASSRPSPAHKQTPPAPPKQTLPAAKAPTTKTSPVKKTIAKKAAAALSAAASAIVDKFEKTGTETPKRAASPARSTTPDEDSQSADEKSSGKRIISEEEAKAALAEKRRLAREQAEREAELERQRQEELKRQEEERLRQEEEEQRRMEEEQLRLLEEHKRLEEEKLKKAIEEQERKEEEEKARREEEARLKAEQERKAKEEAERQRIELEEKLRREEEERAERKKRLEKIMSRTRGKSGTASPSGSGSGSDQPDSVESQHEALSSELSSLESNAACEQYPADTSSVNQPGEHQQSSPAESLDAVNQTVYLGSQSLSSNDLMMPSSENTSLDGSLQAFSSEHASLESNHVPQQPDSEKTLVEVQEPPVSAEVDITSFVADGNSGTSQVLDVLNGANDVKPDITLESVAASNTEAERVTSDAQATVEVPEDNKEPVLESPEQEFSKQAIAVDEYNSDHQTSVCADDVVECGEIITPGKQLLPESASLREQVSSTSNYETSASNAVPDEANDGGAAGLSTYQHETETKEEVFAQQSLSEAHVAELHEETKEVIAEEALSEAHVIESHEEMKNVHRKLAGDDEQSHGIELVADLSEAAELPALDSTTGGSNIFGSTQDGESSASPSHRFFVDVAESSPVADSTFVKDDFTGSEDVPADMAFNPFFTGEAAGTSTVGADRSEFMVPSADITADEQLNVSSSADAFSDEANNPAPKTFADRDFAVETEASSSVPEGVPAGGDDSVSGKDGDASQYEQHYFQHTEESTISQSVDHNLLGLGQSADDNEELLIQPGSNLSSRSADVQLEFHESAYGALEDRDQHPFDTDDLPAASSSFLGGHISLAEEMASEGVQDFSGKTVFGEPVAHQNDLLSEMPGRSEEEVHEVGHESGEMFLRELAHQASETLNPFGATDDVAFEVSKPMTHADAREELLINSLSYGDDSEGSSLDSNLSQILNVHSETVMNSEVAAKSAFQEVLGNCTSSPDNLQSGVLNHQDAFHNSEYFTGNSVPKSNGYTVNNENERIFDCRFESVDHKTDTKSVTSDDFHQDHPVNGKIISDTISSSVDNVDSVNSNKVASNPFHGTSDSNPFAGNPFQVPEEKTFTA